MPMYNWIEYSSNYSHMSGSLCFCYRNEATAFDTDIAETNDFMPVKHKGKLFGVSSQFHLDITQFYKMQQSLYH